MRVRVTSEEESLRFLSQSSLLARQSQLGFRDCALTLDIITVALCCDVTKVNLCCDVTLQTLGWN